MEVERFKISTDYRTSIENLNELAISIQNNGLYQPILVQKTEEGDYEIIAGRRRFRAMTEYLKYTQLKKNVHYIVKEGLDVLITQYEENCQRESFTPAESAKLVSDIHERQIKSHGKPITGKTSGWTMKDTGRLIGRDQGFVSRMLSINENASEVEDCTNVSEALEKISQIKSKNISSKIKEARFSKHKTSEDSQEIDDLLENFYNAPAESFIQSLSEESVDHILTDPPYAINIDSWTSQVSYGTYEDDPVKTRELIFSLLPEYYRVLPEDGYCIIWTSVELFGTLKKEMSSAGFSVAATPLFWIKMNSTGKAMDPTKTLGSLAEVALYAWKGSPSIVQQGRGNTFPYNIVRESRIHVAQKPEALLTDILNIFTYEGQTILDTFGGSLSTLRACHLTNRKIICCEKDYEHYIAAVNYTRDWDEERRKRQQD